MSERHPPTLPRFLSFSTVLSPVDHQESRTDRTVLHSDRLRNVDPFVRSSPHPWYHLYLFFLLFRWCFFTSVGGSLQSNNFPTQPRIKGVQASLESPLFSFISLPQGSAHSSLILIPTNRTNTHPRPNQGDHVNPRLRNDLVFHYLCPYFDRGRQTDDPPRGRVL